MESKASSRIFNPVSIILSDCDQRGQSEHTTHTRPVDHVARETKLERPAPNGLPQLRPWSLGNGVGCSLDGLEQNPTALPALFCHSLQVTLGRDDPAGGQDGLHDEAGQGVHILAVCHRPAKLQLGLSVVRPVLPAEHRPVRVGAGKAGCPDMDGPPFLLPVE